MPTAELLDAIRARKSRSGIVTADRYFREIEGCFDGGFCPIENAGAKSEAEWRKALADAESKLTYAHPRMRVLKRTVKNAPAGEGILQFDCIVTTPRKDHDGDILLTKGAKLNKAAPLLWQHAHMMPIGKVVKQLKQTDEALHARCVIADTALGRDAATLVKLGALRISHGFEPTEWEPLKEDEDGYLFKAFNIFEVSLVSLPSNEDAVITALASKSFDSALVRGWQKSVTGCRCKGRVSVPAEITADGTGASLPKFDGSKERDSRITQKDFDVERQHVEAAKLEYDWISRRDSDPPMLNGRTITKSTIGGDGTLQRERPFDAVEREYFAELAKRGADVLRRTHRHVSLMLKASEEIEEARELDAVLALFE